MSKALTIGIALLIWLAGIAGYLWAFRTSESTEIAEVQWWPDGNAMHATVLVLDPQGQPVKDAQVMIWNNPYTVHENTDSAGIAVLALAERERSRSWRWMARRWWTNRMRRFWTARMLSEAYVLRCA